MALLLARIQELVADSRVRVSTHGFEELANDDIFLCEVLSGLPAAISIEEYPDYHKGPCIKDLVYLFCRRWMTEDSAYPVGNREELSRSRNPHHRLPART